MSCFNATEEALSIIDTLKRCILKQDQFIKTKTSELEALRLKVDILENEKKELLQEVDALKGQLIRNGSQSSRKVEIHNQTYDKKSFQELQNLRNEENRGNQDSSILLLAQEPTAKQEMAAKTALVITVTPERADQSPEHTPKMARHDTLSRSIRRNESITRQRSFSEKYQLSPDLHDKSIKFLERKYGGKERAHWAARVIQLYYRKHTMNQRFTRMRTFSDHSTKSPYGFLAGEEARNATQETPPVKPKRNNSLKGNRRSMLVIDNLCAVPMSPVRSGVESVQVCPQDDHMEEEIEQVTGDVTGEKQTQNENVSESQTEYYVKVEIMENLGNSPAVETEMVEESYSHPSHEFAESDESGEEFNNRDSIDGSCMSYLDVDYDTSTNSELEVYPQTDIKPQKLETRIGIGHFNRKPEKGISYLIAQEIIDDSPDNVARFLLSEPGISKQKLGEYLGNLQNPFNMDVLKYFVEALDFTGMEIDQALRLFQTQFRMPGEAQKIERLMEAFAGQYVACNPSGEENVQDIVLVLAFAIVMLNTDLHSPNVKKRMTEEQFITNLRGTNNGKDFPREILKQIYLRILQKEFIPGRDHVSYIEKLEKKIVGKCPWTTLTVLHRQLRQLTPLFEVRDPNKKEKPHPRIVFVFNDKIVVTKERGKAGQQGGFHFRYSYKNSFSLAGVKVLTFANEFYQCGIQLYSKLESKIVGLFNAKDEQTRKVFVNELLECIAEFLPRMQTNVMEEDRINTWKQKNFGGRRNVRTRLDVQGVYNTMPRRPKRSSEYSPSLDTISLIDTSMESLSIGSAGMLGNKHFSSSLLNISDTDSSYTSEGSMIRSNSSGSLDSAFVDGETFRTAPKEAGHSSPNTQRKKSSSIFGRWRSTTSSKSSVGNKTSPKTSPLLSETRKTSTSSDVAC